MFYVVSIWRLKGRFGKLIAFKIGRTKFSFRGQNAYGCFKRTNEKNDTFCVTQKLGDGYRLCIGRAC
jgi:hypothetical protein